MRGKVSVFTSLLSSTGITPAYAGKSLSPVNSKNRAKDHPRLCGEKVAASQKQACESGSPPPMRGKGGGAVVDTGGAGITPAYAGKSSSLPQNGQGFRDHPRLCGEKSYNVIHFLPPSGSPPPMRGKGSVNISSTSPMGITPAYAGKRKRKLPQTVKVQDHPRLCGEKFAFGTGRSGVTGSPPPMRGKGFWQGGW